MCRAAICFVEGEWPIFGASDHVLQGLRVAPRTLYKHLQKSGPLDVEACRRIAQILASAFPHMS